MTQATSAPVERKTPNYELLKDAYQIIDGIPSELFSLREVVTQKGKSLECGTIACAAGWLSMHPQFQELGLGWDQLEGKLTINGRRFFGAYSDQMAEIFDLPQKTAEHLFNSRGTVEAFTLGLHANASDKAVFLKRLWNYLEDENALTPKVPAC